MTGFETVEKLRELEQKATQGEWFYEDCKYQWDLYAQNHDLEGVCPPDTPKGLKEIFESAHPWKLISANKNGYWPEESDAKLICDLRNAAPLLLDIAGQIQPGDRQGFLELIYVIEDMRIDESCPVCEERLVGYKEMIKRYQRMVERMYEDHY